MSPADEAINPKGRISPAIEDYLKAIYTLGRAQPQVTTSLLAEHLGFKPASVTGMLKTMSDHFTKAIQTGSPLYLAAATYYIGLAQWEYGDFVKHVRLP